MREKRALIISYHFYPETAIGARRPSELARSLRQAGWQVDVLTRRLGPEAEAERARTDAFGRIKGVYQHPGILGPTWFFLKRLRGLLKKSATARDNASPENSVCERQSSPGRGKATKETLKYRVRRNLISLQALLDATKSWLLLSFFYLCAWRLSGRRYGMVLSSSPPASGHLLGLISRSLFRAKWIADLRDPIAQWDVVYEVCKSRLRVGIEDYLERKYMAHADNIVVTTPSLGKEINERYFSADQDGSVTVIYNGFDRGLIERPPRQKDCLKVVYAGALYLHRDPIPFFEAVQRLKRQQSLGPDELHLELYGDCAHWNGIDLRRWIDDRGLKDSIRIHGFLSQRELEPELEDADVLVNFAQKQPRQIPAKTFDYLAYPAVSLVVAERESDTATFMRENGLGYVVESEASEIARILSQLYKMLILDRNASMVGREARAAFSRMSQNARYIALCEAQCSGGAYGN